MTHYDTVVVGGRCAGAATAMLLARAGQRVLVLESARSGSDTLCTHTLTAGAIAQLRRWGLLDAVVAAGTPAIRRREIHYGDHEVDVDDVGAGAHALYAPRRTVLDPILTTAAAAAGARIRWGARVTALLRDGAGRVLGVEGYDRSTSNTFRVTATLTVGADGILSTVARAVRAQPRHLGSAAGAYVYGYWSGPADDRSRRFFRPGSAAGVIPTNDQQVCIWVGVRPALFDALHGDLDIRYRTLLAQAAPALTAELKCARLIGPVRGFVGTPGYLRESGGPGWALVGDAASYSDPITAHGIADALRDAELLARAVLAGPGADGGRRHDAPALPLLAVTDRIASYAWDLAELRSLLRRLDRATTPGVDAMPAVDAHVA